MAAYFAGGITLAGFFRIDCESQICHELRYVRGFAGAPAMMPS
jgi:hypothetical protein